MPPISEGRLRLRVVQAAIVISVIVGGVLLWYQDREWSQHQQRMREIEQLRDEAQRQQAFSDKLLSNARQLLNAVEEVHSAPRPAVEAQPPALAPSSPAPPSAAPSSPTPPSPAPSSPSPNAQPASDSPPGEAPPPASSDLPR